MRNYLNPAIVSGIAIGTLFFSACTADSKQNKNTNEKEKNALPNILLIQADDLGYDDLPINGNQFVETPALEQLAEESVQFTHFYVNPVSAPTRASLLTGRHFLKTGVAHVHGGKDFLNLDETTIAEVFKQNGYTTAMWGKWHSGKAHGYYPWQRGFDQAYMAELYNHKDANGLFNGKHVEHNDWSDKVLADYAIDFITKNQDKPFFAYFSTLTCHAPLQAPENLIKKYSDKGLSPNLSTLYAMIDYLDGQLKRVFDTLTALDLDEKTIVLFMSDNGPAVLNADLTDIDRQIRYVNGYKGHKGNIWENGVKSPLFIRWTNNYQPRTEDKLVDVTDILPTLADIAGIPIPENNKKLDGTSFKNLLANGEINREKYSYNYAGPGWPPTDKPWTPEGVKDEYRPIPPHKKQAFLPYDEQIISVRNNQYKLLFNPGKVKGDVDKVNGYAMFDIQNDPFETTNIIDESPEIFDTLQSNLQAWWQHILQMESSFKMPRFFIGDKGNELLAYAPYKISPKLKNAFHFIAGWNHKGAYAEYKIAVNKSGNYIISIDYEATEEPTAVFDISVGDKKNRLNLSQSNQTNIKLEKGEQILRVELIETGKNKGDYDFKMKEIHFKFLE